jgi:hypothetical protein
MSWWDYRRRKISLAILDRSGETRVAELREYYKSRAGL